MGGLPGSNALLQQPQDGGLSFGTTPSPFAAAAAATAAAAAAMSQTNQQQHLGVAPSATPTTPSSSLLGSLTGAPPADPYHHLQLGNVGGGAGSFLRQQYYFY